MDYEDDVKLPVEIQMWLLEQSGHFLKARFDDNKYEAACVLFERVLCGYKKRELKGKLQYVYSDLINQLERVRRWDFVKAACPFVIQCTAQVLSNRRNLGMSDRLSVAATKLLSTFHWCFVEAPSECELDPKAVLYPAKTIEIFIQLLIPCAHNICEQDLTFSLKSGIIIWQPLWKNLCPDIPSFKRPVMLEKYKRKSKASDSPPSPLQRRGVVKYFDMVVLRSLLSNCLSEDSLVWSLAYILQILQSELFLFCDVQDSWPGFRHQRYGAKKPVAIQHSLPLLSSNFDFRSHGSSAASPEGELNAQHIFQNYSTPKKHDLEPVYLSDAYEQWLKDDGTLKHSAVLNLVYKITQKATLHLCETLLYMLHVLVEIGVINESDSREDADVYLETVVFCLLDLITMIGCCNNDSGMRGCKGQNLRQLSHDMFAKLASTHPEQLSVLTVVYVKNKSVKHLLDFIHSFTGFCFGKLILTPPQSPKKKSLGDIGKAHRSLQSEASQSSCTSEVMEKNENIVINWICIQFLDKLMIEEKSCKGIYRELVSKLLSYIMSNHPKAMRRMVMDGILKSFSKSTNNGQGNTSDFATDSGSKPDVTSPSTKEMKIKRKSKMKASTSSSQTSVNIHGKSRKRLPFMRSKGITVDDTADQSTDISSPEANMGLHSWPRPVKSGKESMRFATHNTKFKFFKGNKRPRYATVVYGPVDEENASVFLEKSQKPKKINLQELLKGMKAFRFMSCFVAPGHLPETALIAALMDLKAPVLARAALLLECCHFVHMCNKGGWDSLSRPDFISKKDLAVMLYKWGIAVGGKLAVMVKKDIKTDNESSEETRRFEPLERHVLYEGDLTLMSSECPYTIKLLACQLLLEITAFLRDNYLTHLLERDTSSACSPRSYSESPRKISTASTSRSGKSPHLRVPITPAIAVQDETGSSTQGTRRFSGYTRYGVSTSPKYQRKISRKTTKGHYLQGERRMSRPYKDNQHITSSFDEDDEIPSEAADFPWMSSVILFIKTANKKIVQSKYDSALSKLERSWQNLYEGLDALYNPKKDSLESTPRRSALVGDLLNQQEKIEKDEKDPILDYIKCEVAGLQHAPLSVMCKAALVSDRLQIMEVMPCAWNLLTHPDQHLASTAAALVLIAGAKLDSFVTSFIKKEMSKADPTERAKAVIRFGILWKYRNNAFAKMEINAMATLRILPPKIEYTLPSPLIGRDPPPTTDAPWIAGSPFEEETGELKIIQTEWYYDEEKRLLLKERQRTERLKELRKGYQLRNVPFSQDARIEAKRKSEDNDEEEVWSPQMAQDHCADVQELFPPAICAVALDVIRLLDDTALDNNKLSVSCLAYQVVWQCLTEEPELFLRTVYEKITKTDKQEEILLVLRKLVQQIPDLPPVAGTLLFNNLAGLIMYYNRTNKPGCQERISSVLDILWKVAPSVSDLFLKEMKQTLRKENCEHIFMITANVPGIKEIRVAFDKNSFKKFEVKEGMTFSSLIEECEKAFNSFDRSFVLIDKHSGALMEGTRQIRDTYTFKRGYTAPVLKLEKMDRFRCYEQRQRQALSMKLAEISRLNLSKSIFSKNPSQKHITFLFLEFLKQNAFPRRAIEFEFDLCQSRGLAKELMGLDVILKDTWVKFVCLLLGHLCESTTAGYEIELFLNVINGALLLLCENVVILRSCLAVFLTISKHFGHIFAVNGYSYILPTLLKAYSQHQDNSLVVDAIEFIVGQFFNLHQSPFLLQLFASAAPMVRSEVTQDLLDSHPSDHIPAGVLCKLLLSLDKKIDDSLDILSLVCGEKSIQPYDPACKIESVEFSVTDTAIRLAVTVIACEPRSQRGTEMLVVITAVIPHYLLYLKQQTELSKTSDDDNEIQELMTKELKQLRILYNYLKVIIDNSKHLSSSFASEFVDTPEADGLLFDDDTFTAKPSILSSSWWGGVFSNIKSWFGWGPDHLALSDDIDRISVSDELPISSEERNALKRFCLPRMSLLFLVTEFLTNAASRVKEVRYLIRRKISFPDIVLEEGQVSILTNIVSSVLSLAPKNQDFLLNVGLQRFILYAVSSINWNDGRQGYFAQIVHKVNKVLKKIINHQEHHDCISWDILEIILRGINLTIWKQPQLCAIPVIKEMLDWCLQVILCENFNSMNYSFSNMAAKLAARLIQAKPDTFNLPVVCGDYHLTHDQDRVEKFLINWLLPLCFRLGTGRYDYPRLCDDDVKFALSIILTLLSPICPEIDFGSNINIGSTQSLDNSDNFTAIRTRSSSQSIVLTPKTYKILFLGLKILIVAFEDSFKQHWKQIAEAMERLMESNKNEPCLWDFFHFIIDNRSPLLIYLLPIVAEKVSDEDDLSNEIRSHKTRIERDLWCPTTCCCRGDVLRRLLDDLIDLKRGYNETEVLQPLSPPPKGRIRSKSTHNDRSVVLAKFDKDWENYDNEQTNDPFDDGIDGGLVLEQVPKRKKSSKRVTIFAEPTVIDEEEDKKEVVDVKENTRRTSSKRILKNRPLLKRQSAEDDDEEPSAKEKDVAGAVQNKSEGPIESKQAFNWQRFNHIRKKDDGRSSRTRKRERWRRDNSYRYRKKMEHQISFNEDEEVHVGSEEEKEIKANVENGLRFEDKESKVNVENDESLWTKDVGFGKVKAVLDEKEMETLGNAVESKAENEEKFTDLVDSVGKDKTKIESKESFKTRSATLRETGQNNFVFDDENENLDQRTEESVLEETIIDDAKHALQNEETSFKMDGFKDDEFPHVKLDLDIHKLILLESKRLQNPFYYGPTLSPSASSDVPLIDDSRSEEDVSFTDEAISPSVESDTAEKKDQVGNGVSPRDTESIEVSRTMGSESFEK